jgi:hypothetical protein
LILARGRFIARNIDRREQSMFPDPAASLRAAFVAFGIML